MKSKIVSNPFIIPFCCLLMVASCAPQAELVKTRTDITDVREDTKATKARVSELQKRLDQDIQKRLDGIDKRIEGLDANLKGTVDAQKVMADYGAKSDQLATDIQLLHGKLEENNFRIAELAQKLDDKSIKIAELSAKLDELEAKLKLVGTGTTMPSTGQSGTAIESDKKTAPKTIEPSEAYRQAKSDYDKGNFELALAGFQNYIVQFPDTSLAASAQYWIGECFAARKEYQKAIEAFGRVVKSYPKSEKVPGAKLKIGLTYLNEKNTAKAKEQLNKVIKEHPGTNEAEIAKDRLHKIGP